MNTIPKLKTQHIQQLEVGSGIARKVISERGVRSIAHGRELPKGFSWRQRRRGTGILFTVHRPNGETSWSFRPDEPDPKDPGRKYEQPSKHYGGPGIVLDVHPRMRHPIDDPGVEITFVEGIKKADALVSRGVLAVGITGVWNWLSDGEPIADMLEIPVDGRRVNICFDSDMLHNPNVQDAARRLAEHLASRGADVWVTYLPDKSDGSKMGADDFLAAGGTVSELRMLMRRYDPADFTLVRVSRDERLQLALEDLACRFWDFEWQGMGGHSARDVYLKLIEAARHYGKAVDDGIRVTKAWGPLELEAKVSRRTLAKALNRLEEWGLLYRDNKDRKPDKTGAFVLRANVNHYRRDRGTGEQATQVSEDSHQRGLQLRAPRLRWSSPGSRPRRGTVQGTRMVRKGVRRPPKDPIKRLGKIRGAIVDVLDAAGGTAILQEIADALHRARPRDLRRRNLPMLEETGIVVVEGDVVHLAENWLEALEAQRELGREVTTRYTMIVGGVEQEVVIEGADELAARRHKLKSRAFHSRHRRPADEAPDEDEMRDRREGYAERRRQAIEEALSRLFAERPEYRTRRAGQVTCAIINYIAPHFPRGQDGAPKDAEVEAILEGRAA